MSKKLKSQNCTGIGLLAMLAAVATLISFATAIFMDPNWTFGVDTLSALGISTVPGVADLFNLTCIIGGIVLFIIGVIRMLKKSGLDMAVAVLLALSGIFLVGVGLVHLDSSGHVCIASTYGILIILAIVISMIADWQKGRKLTAVTTIVFVVIMMGCVPMPFPALEVIAIALACAWMFLQGLSWSFSKS